MPKLVVVGSLNMDLVVRTPHLPRPGETILGRDFMTAPEVRGKSNGSGAKLGAAIHMVGRVGGDDFGRALRENLCSGGCRRRLRRH
jgi:ribokinase